MRALPQVLVVGAFSILSACSSQGDTCDESSRDLATHDTLSSLGFSLSDAVRGQETFAATIDWRNAPDWVGLKASGTTRLEAQLSYAGDSVREVSANRTERLSTTDERTCASRIESRAALVAQTEDGAFAYTGAVDVVAFESDVVRFRADVPASALVAADVTLAWHEEIEAGQRVGRLIASRGPASGDTSGLSRSQVHTIAEWIVK